MDEIFNNLTKIHELRIISYTSVEQYRNTSSPFSEIGKMLDVDYIVEGSGQKFGRTFRLRVQLIEASTDRHIWAKSYQQRMKSTRKFFRIQNGIAQDIATELKAIITQAEEELIEKIPTASITAYNLYLKANSYQSDIKNTHNQDAYKTAVDLYKASLEIDPSFARAYTGLAFAYWNRYYYETYFKENFLDSCLFLAEKALSSDYRLDEAYFIKGQYYRVNGQSEEALKNYDLALEINPNYFAAYERKGYTLTWTMGDYVKGLSNYYKALDLVQSNERPPTLKALARAYLDAGFPEKAKYYYNEAFALDGNKASFLSNQAFLEFCMENFEEALKLWKQLETIDPKSIASMDYYFVTPGYNNERYFIAEKDIENFKKSGVLNLIRSHRAGYANWMVGKKKEAKYYFNQQIRYCEESIKLKREFEQRKAAYYDLAATYAFLGDRQKAYKYLDEFSKRDRFPLSFVTFTKHDLLFEHIRNEERFRNILNTIETKYQTEHERVRKWLAEQQIQ
jgi:TolB-like protein/Tfp pilus assembly protein PilF